MRITIIFILIILLSACSIKPRGVVITNDQLTSIDYGNLEYWAASPFKQDPSDNTPSNFELNAGKASNVDIFFIHPTTYTGERTQNQWNAPIDDPKLNKKTDEGSILYQASVFNGVGRIFAPRYRQAHFHAYITKDQFSAKRSLDIAYQDVRAAFKYYIEHHNNGNGIIIASHSQGTTHAAKLIKEFFEGQKLQKQLVVAYLLGLPVPSKHFNAIDVCESPEQTQCFCSWRTWRKSYKPKKIEAKEIAVVNPLSWTTESTYIPKTENLGALIFFEDGVFPYLVDAQINDQILWASKPKFKGSFLMRFKNYHRGDFNLYYANIRENAILRSRMYEVQ